MLSVLESAPALPVTEVSFLGTQPQAVAVRGEHAFVADVHGLSVVQVASDQLQPVASLATPGLAQDVAVTGLGGRRAFVADGAAGVAIVDISAPGAPRLVGHAPGVASAFRVSAGPGGVAVAAADAPVVSLLDPETGALLDSVTLDGVVTGLAWAGGQLHVAGRGIGLIGFRVSRGRLVQTWTAAGLDDVRAVAGTDSWLYGFSAQAEVLAYDASGLTPVLRSREAVSAIPGRAFALPDVLVATGATIDAALFLDRRDPAAPTPMTVALDRRELRAIAAAGRVREAGNRDPGEPERALWIAADDSPGLVALTSGFSPTGSRSVAISAELPGARVATLRRFRSGRGLIAYGAFTAPDHAAFRHVASGGDRRAPVRVIDLGDRSDPASGSPSVYPGPGSVQPGELVIGCGEFLCRWSRSHGLDRVPVVQPGARTAAGPQAGGEAGTDPSRSMAAAPTLAPMVDGALQSSSRLLWLMSESAELEGIDLTHGPSAALFRVRLPGSPNPAPGRLAASDHAVVVVEPRSARARFIDTRGLAASLAGEDGDAGGTGDTAEPVRIAGEFLLQDRVLDVAIARPERPTPLGVGDLVMFAEWRFGLQILDIGRPQRPREVLWQPMDPWPWAVAARVNPDGLVIIGLGLGEHGVALASWRRGQAGLEILGLADTPGLATGVAFAGDFLWVADHSAVLRLPLPAPARIAR